MDRKQLGKFGENIACYYLKNKGYKILERNYIKEQSALLKGEIDIIAEQNKTIYFIEVKTLNSATSGFFNPEDKVDFQKRKKLINLAQIWLSEKQISLDSKWQIDAVSVKVDLISKKAKIKHFKNIVA